MSKTQRILCLVALMAVASYASASTLTVGTTYSGRGWILVDPTDVLAQPFVMPAAGTIDSLNIYVDPRGQYTLWLTNHVGAGTTWDNVLFSQTLTGTPGDQTVTVPVGVDVDAGQYYLIMSVQSGYVWWAFGTPTVGTSGTSDQYADGSRLNTGFIPASSFYGYSYPLTFEIWDDPAAIEPNVATVPTPEPTSLALLGSGLLSVGFTRRKRK